MRDPDVLYNMLKNLLAQIKVRGPAGHRRGEREKSRLEKNQNLPPQSHPDAWPFMEPVKKSEAPDYYEIIRFPIGQYPPVFMEPDGLSSFCSCSSTCVCVRARHCFVL